MENPNKAEECTPHSHLSVIDHIMELPKNILQNHHKDGLADFILHSISGDKGFAFSKAAYLVDNPDFNCLKGISGYCKTSNPKDCSGDLDGLISNIGSSDYNSKVKTLQHPSLRAKNIDLSSPENLKDLSETLGMKNPEIFSWDLKHDNYGLLVFESEAPHCCDWKKSLLEKVSSMFGMCSLF